MTASVSAALETWVEKRVPLGWQALTLVGLVLQCFPRTQYPATEGPAQGSNGAHGNRASPFDPSLIRRAAPGRVPCVWPPSLESDYRPSKCHGKLGRHLFSKSDPMVPAEDRLPVTAARDGARFRPDSTSGLPNHPSCCTGSLPMLHLTSPLKTLRPCQGFQKHVVHVSEVTRWGQ